MLINNYYKFDMLKIELNKNNCFLLCKCSFLILVINISNQDLKIKILQNKIKVNNENNFTDVNTLYDILSNKNISKNTVLIFEPFTYHYECTPGFTKYFIDLGYNVDIIMHDSGLSSFFLFEDLSKIRFFIYNDISDITNYTKYLSLILINYNYVLIETVNPNLFTLYKSLNLLNINHSFFVFHHLEYLKAFSQYILLNKEQKWSLGNFTNFTQINPHYFGNILNKKKNKITRFFITSTIWRKYEILISAVEVLKDENLEFQVIVVGKWNTFTQHNISEKVRDNFIFKYNITYSELYNEVNNSDFIIINLDPYNIKDISFKTTRVTGSSQLVYGFLKPAIINKKFAFFYNLNSNNSFIYKNSNFTDTMRNAINLNDLNYQKMKKNLEKTAKNIYKNSLDNVNICMNKL